MALPSAPSVTFNAEGNVLPITTSLAGGGSTTTGVDFSVNALGGWMQVYGKGGATVAATNGVQVAILPQGSAGGTFDSIPMWIFSFGTTANTAARESIFLPTGRYAVALLNLDATNAINVGLTTNPVS
jgi:hypothetical protein